MANDWLIGLTAGLDEKKSRKQIKKDIEKLRKNLNSIELTVKLSAEQKKEINSQLDTLEINLDNISISESALKGLVTQINDALGKIEINGLNVTNGNVANEAENAGEKIGRQFNKGISQGIKSNDTVLSTFKQKVKGLGMDSEKVDIVEKRIKGFAQNIESLNATMTKIPGQNGKKDKNILSVNISGTDEYGQIIKLTQQYDAANGDLIKSIDAVSSAQQKAGINTNTFIKQQKTAASNLTNQINQLNRSANDQNATRPIKDTSHLTQLSEAYNNIISAIQKMRSASADTFTDEQNNVKTLISNYKSMVSEFRNAENVATKMKGTDFANGLSIAKNDLEKFKSDAKEFPQITKTIQDLDIAIANVGDSAALNNFNEQLRVAKTELSKVKSEINSANRSEKLNINISGLESKIANLQRISPEIANFKTRINGAEVSVESLLEDLSKINTQSDFSVINSKFTAFKNAAKSAGIATSEFSSIVKNQFKQVEDAIKQTFSIAAIGMAAISKTKESITELKQIDTYLTEISKSNDKLTASELKNIGNNSFDIASKYGKVATDYLAGVQEASRAGYVNAEGIAELSVAAQGAGDMTAELANKYIIATDKAYKLGGSVEKLTEILDGSNYITNHNAVNMSELAEGMSIVGSQAASLGVDANETTAALGTMIAVTQQSGSEMARAFRAILLNIRQISDADEGIDAEGLTKYEKACNALNVSLKETKNGVTSLRDPMEVTKELSVEYSKLSENDIRRTNLLNSVGGKLRANALDALLKNYDMYSTMLEQYAQGTGSMAVEAEKTANSLEGSLNRLSNTWTDTVDNVVNSDGLKFIVNTLNVILSGLNGITDWLGSAGSIGAGVGIITSIKNVGRDKMYSLFVNCFKMPTVY